MTTTALPRIDTAPASLRGVEGARRGVLVSMLWVAAAAHIPVIAPHLHEAPYMGVLFLLFTVVVGVLGGVLFSVRSRALELFAGVLCILGVLTYIATRAVAFPQLPDDVGNWMEPLGVVSVVSETIAAVVAMQMWRSRRV